MAADAGRGYQGERRQGADAGRAGRGMGRGAGRNAGRGNGRGDNKSKYSWKRNEGDGDHTISASSNPSSAMADTSSWDAAAATRRQEHQDGSVWVEKQRPVVASEDTESGQTSSPARHPHGKQNIAQVPPTKNIIPCPICKSNEHPPARCPQVFCERCNKLGHLASVCTAFIPWECIAPMCAFQSKGQGFYYIHDSCTASQLKERSNNIVVTIVEGETSTRQMELDLSDYLAVGSKGIMEVAWVRVINIPLDKRSERNVAFVASLVGIPLEIDIATLHRPASVRVKLGCRNVDAIPGIAESVLGGHFYDFAYEVEQVLIRDPNGEENEIRVPPSSDEGNHKKSKQDVNPGAQLGSISTGLGGKSLPIPQRGVPDPIRESQESVESDDSLHTTLLIETLKYEHEQGMNENVVEVVGQIDSTLKVVSDYRVESPEMNVEVIPTPPLIAEENLRFSLRNMQSKLERVEDRAAAAAKKRNMEV